METDADGNLIGESVPETDADGNLIGESVSETDADGNPFGESVTQTDADGSLITEATSETAADGGSTGETSADAGTQKNEETTAGETQGLNSSSTTPATEFWTDLEQTTTAANEPTTEAAVSGMDAETNGGSGMASETTSNSSIDTETTGSSDMDTETTGNSGMDSETTGGSDMNSETSGAAESGDGAEIRQSEPVEVVQILNDLIPLSGTIASGPSEAANSEQTTEAPAERETEATVEQTTEAPTTVQAPEEPTTAQPTEAPTTVQAPEESTTAQPTEAPTTVQAPEESTEQKTETSAAPDNETQTQQEVQPSSDEASGDPTEGTASAIENNDGENGDNGDGGAGGSWWSDDGPLSSVSGLGGGLEDDLEDEEDDLSTYLSDEYMEEYQRLLFSHSSSGTDTASPLLSIDYGAANARAISIPADRLGLSEVAPISLFDLEPQDITDLLTDVTITDKATGEEIDPKDGALVVGNTYTINLKFSEVDIQHTQFESDVLTYQIPTGFRVGKRNDQPLEVKIGEQNILIGTYSVDEEGLLTITLNEDGKKALAEANDVELNFELEGTLQASAKGSDGVFNFGGAGGEFEFKVVDQPCVSVEKDGVYTQDADAKGGKLAYTVKTTVEHGGLHDGVVTDVLTPPQTSSLNLEMMKKDGVPDVTVKVKKANGEEVTLGANDYELVQKGANPENPSDLEFQVKLKGNYAELNEGDELYVTYNYDVRYVEGATDAFWGNVLNEVTVTGFMPVEDPVNPGETEDVPVEEHQSSNVEIWASPPGDGVIFKTQAYSETTHTLHYTLYTMVPAGTWSPLYIQDDMIVEYNNNRWYIPEFKEEEEHGRVQNLKVSAVDVAAAPEGGWENLSDPERIGTLESYKKDATVLKGYSFQDLELDGYDPGSVDKYVYRLGETTLNIIFGLTGGRWDDDWGKWGSWKYDKDRLIITEYDLVLSGSDPWSSEMTLMGLDLPGETLTLTTNEVLLAGIKNTVNLRYSMYYPGYRVFFNNAEKMNKAGKLNKNDNTIEYTVSLNTTDQTVQNYFNDNTA